MKKIFSTIISSPLKGRLCGLLFALLATTTLWAHDFAVNGIYYNFLDGNNVAVTYRGNYASSYDDEYFGEVIIPETVTYNGTTCSVTRIGEDAFWGCSSLTSVTIPNSVTSIREEAFWGCSSLTSITIPNSVTSIGDYAFNSCTSLTSVTIPNSVTSIGASAFRYCSSLTSITIPEGVTSIGESAFSGCSSLTSVTIPEGVTSIGESAFSSCSSLTSITIPEGVTSIGESAFWGCSSLTSITIPNSVTTIGDEAFWICSSLTSITIPNSVTSIGERAFYNCSSLTSITIPNSVTSIGEDAFRSCSSLTSVTLNSNDIVSTSRMSNIFGSQVEEYVIGNSVTSIGASAFRYCSSLTSVTIGNSVTSIGEEAFRSCSSLTSVTIGESVTSIGGSAFSSCSSLTSITIPNSVTSIGDYAFNSCTSLTSVTIPNSVTSIGERAFSYCSSLTSVTIGNSVTSIGDEAFRDCSSLTSITIPNSVTSIGSYAFSNCSSLTSMIVENGNTIYDSRENCNAIIETATNTLIAGCQNTIIPNNVTSIGDYAFDGCSSLTSITCEAITPPIVGENAFNGVSRSIPVYVPCGTVSVYNAAKYWSAFSNIQEPLAEYSITVSVNDSIMGSANVDRNSICGNQISATPNFGYHFVQWSDGSTENPRTLTLTQDTILTAEFAQTISGQCGNSLYWNYEAQNNLLSITGTDGMYDYETSTNTAGMLTCAEARDIASESNYQGTENVTIYGYVTNIVNSKYDSNTSRYKQCFHMSDTKNGGNTFYAYWAFVPNYFSVGDKVTLTGKLKNYNGTEEIVDGEAAHFVDMPNNPTPWLLLTNSIKEIIIENGATSIGANAFNGCSEINKITLSNSLQSIGRNAFSGCASIKDVTLPASVKSIGENAFAGCTKLYDIYCYAMEPPTAYESSFANYNAFLHVPCDNQRVYLLDVIFGNFKYIECIEAEITPTDTVVVTPSFNDAEFIWPSNSSADSYTLAISKDGEIFCTLTFNANGQLTGIAFAPSRNGQHNAPAAAQTANGFAFTVTGLDEGVNYTYDLLIQDRSGNTLQTYSGEFRTQSTDDRTVTVEYDAAQGQVTGAGTYLVGDTVTLTATPNDGYRFVRWSNEVEDNPYTFVISNNVTLSAEFEAVIHSDVENATPSQQSNTHKLLRNGQLLILRDGKTYNIMGAEIQ